MIRTETSFAPGGRGKSRSPSFDWTSTGLLPRHALGGRMRATGTMPVCLSFLSALQGSERMGLSFEHPVDVRWRDVDALGHVNHAVFLTYLEEARDAFFMKSLGSDPLYVVVRIEVDLRAEVRYPDRRVTG